MGVHRPVFSSRRTIGRFGRALLALVLLAAILVVPLAGPAEAAGPFTVNSTGDDGDSSPGDGVCRTGGGVCTLRAAVEEANASAGPDTINFGIGGGGPHVIDIDDQLVLNDRSGGTTIDGYSQPGARVNTSPDEFNASIGIHITTDDALAPMLLIQSAANTVRGISIYGNGPRIELRGEDADGNRFLGNVIGTDPAGDFASSAVGIHWSLNVGIAMNLGPDQNVVGTAAVADRNVISGNGSYGVRINHGETSQNVIENNIIGLSGDLTKNPRQGAGIDLQWYTWRNYIVDNLISGNGGQAVDLSHSTVNNVVVGNYMGTLADGDSANSTTDNRWGVTVKDNAHNNWVVDNVIGGNWSDGIWHKHNYTLGNNVLNNRIGVGVDGSPLGNGGWGVELTGQDDLYLNNIIANNADGGIYVHSYLGSGPNFPSVPTAGNRFLENTFYDTPGPYVDIDSLGQNSNDFGDRDTGSHTLLNYPEISGIGPGQIYGWACGGCTVEVYVSGQIQTDGTLNTNTTARGEGAAWIGRVQADGSGYWSLASNQLRADKIVTLIAVDPAGNTSEARTERTVPSSFLGSGSNPGQSLGRTTAPTAPGRPPAYAPDEFTCSWSGGVLSWENEGANEYFVRTIAADGGETYLGGFTGTGTTVPNADGYRVVNWAQGFARTAVCDGPGDQPDTSTFSCSYANGTLSWSDEGAGTYYVRLVDDAGDDSYHAAASGTSLSVPPSAGYMVVHWNGGRHATTCPGGSDTTAFTCSHANGTLSWTDEGASTYYVRLVDNAGVDSYFGSSTGTSLDVPASAGYQVLHWVSGRSVATC
ncbi:MAG: CSLREA domain-containing protein [Actinomycetota bacterium]